MQEERELIHAVRLSCARELFYLRVWAACRDAAFSCLKHHHHRMHERSRHFFQQMTSQLLQQQDPWATTICRRTTTGITMTALEVTEGRHTRSTRLQQKEGSV